MHRVKRPRMDPVPQTPQTISLLATLEHVDERHGALAQRDPLGCRNRVFSVGFVGFLGRRLGVGDGFLQRGDGRWHLLGQDDALGSWLLADDLKNAFAIGLQQDQVAGGFGFEDVQHVAVSGRWFM